MRWQPFSNPDEDPDAEPDGYFEWLIGELDAGREPVPDEPAMAGPDELAGAGFEQGEAADVMPPGPVLAALAGQAVAEAGSLSDDALLGVISAARRLQAYHEHLELAGIAEYARRTEARVAASTARGDRRLKRDGEFAAEELGFELLVSRRAAGERMDLAVDLARRLPATFAGMAAGTISGPKAALIHRGTWYLSDTDAAAADEVLAASAPGLRPDSVGVKAARLARKLDPEAARRHKEEAKADRRVEIRQEASGNASLAGRELDSADVLAAKSSIWAEAEQRRAAGAPGRIDEIRARVYLDRLLGRTAAPDPALAGTPFPALINVIVPAGIFAGEPGTLGQAGGLGLLDGDDSRAVVAAASRHPETRWCVTVTDDATGQATAHGCARGQHPWRPPSAGTGPGVLAALIRHLNVQLEPIARGACDHRHREGQYLPSRRLRHLMLARTTTCPARGCGAQSLHNEADHTIAWPRGATDECNISPPCARHHHAKHAPGWKLEQPAPGVMRWTTPSGRVYTTHPDAYET
jgi:hypothetical protein